MDQLTEVQIARKKKNRKTIIIIVVAVVAPFLILFTLLSLLSGSANIEGVQGAAQQSALNQQADSIFREANAAAAMAGGMGVGDAEIDVAGGNYSGALRYDPTTNQLTDGGGASSYICVTGPQPAAC